LNQPKPCCFAAPGPENSFIDLDAISKEFDMLKVFIPVLIGLTCVGCTPEGPERKETSKVIGQVLVDDKPIEGMAVYCHNTAGIDTAQPTMSACFTGKDGKFEVSTYQKGDGVPEGDYTLTFLWGQFNISMQYGGPDKLNKRYEDPKKSEVKFTVVSGQPTDLGQIKLTTK
jgi:5-hydroxyisourate hydrolase-like protein (transthyretin family)